MERENSEMEEMEEWEGGEGMRLREDERGNVEEYAMEGKDMEWKEVDMEGKDME